MTLREIIHEAIIKYIGNGFDDDSREVRSIPSPDILTAMVLEAIRGADEEVEAEAKRLVADDVL